MRGLALFLFCIICCIAVSQAGTNTKKWAQPSWYGFGYYEYLPDSYNPATSTKHPVIIHLHGAGQKGNGDSELWRVLDLGIGQLIRLNTWPSSFDFIVINPQAPTWWDDFTTEHVVDYIWNNYPKADRTRIYITGLSMGGQGAWNYPSIGINQANKIAAIVPVCGAHGLSSERTQILIDSHMPVWAFHNDGDPTITPWITNNMISALNAGGISPVANQTIYASDSHDAWTAAYNPSASNTNNIYSWMLRHSRPANAPTTAPSTCPSPSVGFGTGLRGVYFRGHNFNETVGVRRDQRINFTWTTGPGISNLPTTGYSVRWTGNLLAKQSGIHTFYTQSNGGIRLILGSTTVINLWNNHPTTVTARNFTMTKGTSYPITLEFFQREWSQSNVYLAWSHSCIEKEIIPQSQLSPSPINLC